jgi:transcriptional regulator with XRE-family HTH domain
MPKPKQTIGDKVASALVAAGCTNRDPETVSLLRVQQLTGTNNGTVRRIILGERDPSIGTLAKLFEPLGIDVVVEFRPRKTYRKKPKPSTAYSRTSSP